MTWRANPDKCSTRARIRGEDSVDAFTYSAQRTFDSIQRFRAQVKISLVQFLRARLV
jgi:hypothetical protein